MTRGDGVEMTKRERLFPRFNYISGVRVTRGERFFGYALPAGRRGQSDQGLKLTFLLICGSCEAELCKKEDHLKSDSGLVEVTMRNLRILGIAAMFSTLTGCLEEQPEECVITFLNPGYQPAWIDDTALSDSDSDDDGKVVDTEGDCPKLARP